MNTGNNYTSQLTAAKHSQVHADNCGRVFDMNHLPMASAARRRGNTAIGVNCAHVEA